MPDLQFIVYSLIIEFKQINHQYDHVAGNI